MNNLNPEVWLKNIKDEFQEKDYETIKQAVELVQLVNTDNKSITGASHLNQGLITAEILRQLKLDPAALAAAILYNSVEYGSLTLEDVTEHLDPQIAKLIQGTQQMDSISEFYQTLSTNTKYQHNVDNIKKMFLAMVDDIRVVLIKLAQHLSVLRSAKILPENIKKQLAQETMEIYAPLTNRLGIAQIKWELEDLAFLYLEPEKHKKISSELEKYFPESNKCIGDVVAILEGALTKTNIGKFKITGRTKHVYSIHKKMYRKKVGLGNIYDVSAIRIFVPNITDCYTALSHVHETWNYISKEFDDYIAAPKQNGYRSIHTAVYGPDNCVVEIQIRTYDMHQEAELGVAAHWVYKEGKQLADYNTKLAWLRQIIDWQKEVSDTKKNSLNIGQIFNDHVYVFTPQGDVLELLKGATPIDFAYHIHSELGHHCSGAKVNGTIVPLTYKLKTGDRVEILTTKNGSPSRDWLVSRLGFLNTSKAKVKVLHWFKKQSKEHKIIQGQALLDKELKKLNINKIDLKKVAHKLNFKHSEDLLATLGSGDLKLSNLLDVLKINIPKPKQESILTASIPKQQKEPYVSEDINIQGIGNLLVHTANCCKPIPGEEIIGYITQGKGISIHRSDCINALHTEKNYPERFILVSWGKNIEKKYPVDIAITSSNKQGIVRDITNLFAEEKILITKLDLIANKKDLTAKINLTIKTAGLGTLNNILGKISKLPNVIRVYKK